MSLSLKDREEGQAKGAREKGRQGGGHLAYIKVDKYREIQYEIGKH